MSRKAARSRIAWEDRFETPTIGRLLAGLSREHASLVTHARKGLLAAAESEESLRWFGHTWRWTIAYRLPHAERPWAFVIPRPVGPQLAIPLDHKIVADLPLQKFSRHLREGLAAAPRVGNTYWAQWDVSTPMQVDEVLSIAQRRWKHALATVA